MIQPGEMDKRITIQKSVSIKAPSGHYTDEWQDVCKVWAAAKDVSGKLFFEAAAHQMEDITTFTIWWRGDIKPTMRIVYKGVPYEIIHISELGHEGDIMVIKAREEGARQ